jgi:D-aminoacyl-tRNA deacylase
MSPSRGRCLSRILAVHAPQSPAASAASRSPPGMVACVQRCSRAEIRVGSRLVGAIGAGLLVLVGIEREDEPTRADALSERLLGLRIFEDEAGKMNRSVSDFGGELLIVSQFTLAASLDRGRRPAFDRAAPAEQARRIYERLILRLRATGLRVATGEFGERMSVALVNEGPATFLLYER